jgi:uncharacterized membrane protein
VLRFSFSNFALGRTGRVLAVCFFVLVTAFCCVPFSSAAGTRQLVIQHFDDTVVISADGTVEVTENLEVRFSGTNWHGIYRAIPVEYTDPHGFDYKLLIDPISVTDDTGHSLKYEQSPQGRNTRFKIYVPDPDNSTRTVVIRYRVLDALRFFDDHDELYWNVTGNESDIPVESATASIQLPSGVTGLHATAFTGATGSRAEDARIDTIENVVNIATTRPLGRYQGLTAVVGWDKGFVHPPSSSAKFWLFLRSNWPLVIPFIVFAVMFWLWWTRGRDPARQAIAVQYEPPDKLTPGECGTLVDNEAAMRDITATLVDLAVKGYMTIEQTDESHLLGLSHSKAYTFHLKKPPAQWSGARPHEQQMLSAIFDGGAHTDVKLSQLQNHFYTSLPAIRNSIFDALMNDGYYLHRPDTVRQGYIGSGFVVGILMVVLGTAIANHSGAAPLPWIVSGIISGAIICIFGWFMPARTLTGARTLEKVLGFEDFLGRVEGDRIERIERTPELFEKYLPYAMALHVEKKWVQTFSGIAMQPPSWYQGPYGSGFVPLIFVNDLNMMSMQAASTMVSAPRSSGGSGFGGGGMSGGGFGGGSVGGF